MNKEPKFLTGTVKWFIKNKGYGFIEAGVGRDVFVHISSIQDKDDRVLEQGDEVSFEMVESPKGPQAFEVRKTSGSQILDDRDVFRGNLA